jgi:hypothetical protein
MPVRKIPKNYLGVTGGFASRKNGRLMGFESLLERDYMLLLEHDADVATFEEQPVRIPVQSKGQRSTTYVPDVLIHFHAGRRGKPRRPRLAEVKKRSDLERNKEKYAPKFAAAKRFASERGWDFRIVTETDIRKQILSNLKFLREYHLIEPGQEEIDHVFDTMETMGGKADVSALLNSMHNTDDDRLRSIPVIWHLVATGRLSVDLDQPITDRTILSLSKRRSRP